MSLPPCKFTLYEHAWAKIDGKTHYCHIYGFQDASQFRLTHSWHNVNLTWRGVYIGWAYYVTLQGEEGDQVVSKVVRECDLDKTSEHTFQLEENDD